MLRLILGFVFVLALAFAAAWLADQPGQISLRWGGYEITTSVLVGGAAVAIVVIIAILIWRSYYWLTGAPGAIGDWLRNRGRRKGFDALSHGLIAASAGDAAAAAREVSAAERHLGSAPLTLLLKSQAAQLNGQPAVARRAFEAMLAIPDTETMGLRGLYLEAGKSGDTDEARRLVMRAVSLKPSMGWATEALFGLQTAERDWNGARQTLTLRRRYKNVDKAADDRARAVMLTAEAQSADDEGRDDAALEAATAAHKLAPELVPAAVIAGRILAERGETGRSAKIVEKAWRLAPHPDLATIFAHARPGDSTRDRLRRVRQLTGKSKDGVEGPIAIAVAAIEAHEWKAARLALAPLLETAPTRRACIMMAEIEKGELGNRGGVREWLARAVTAERDPAWTADGHVADRWLPVSPDSGGFDVYRWRVPVEGALPPTGIAIENLGFDDPEGQPALIADLPDALPSPDSASKAATSETVSDDAGTDPKVRAATARTAKALTVDTPQSGAPDTRTRASKTKKSIPGKDGPPKDDVTVFVAPIPDDPGVYDDDQDRLSAEPKDIGS